MLLGCSSWESVLACD
uniref:Uncharacterized protein n=1 Tax=Anguilla anguilla TaxID=7936 RepID=A0A0E9U6E2_ANGAN